MYALLVALGFLPVTLSVVVETSFGNIVGHDAATPDGFACEEFLGIPFAKPPRRFEAPKAWNTPYGEDGLVAAEYGAWCPQTWGSSVSGSEDCLFLNIWRPKGSVKGDNLTMMVWIHGGGYTSGDAGDREMPNTYNGCSLAARHDVVIAGMNYRLGPLGFAAFGKQRGVDANFGIEDQREALRWLRREALDFGIDVTRITIFGESAGAMSVFHHLASTGSAGLFRAAISESGLPTALSRDYGLENTIEFGKRVGCNQAKILRTCLMRKSLEELVMAESSSSAFSAGSVWGSVVDGHDLLDNPRSLFLQNRTQAVPVLAGGTTDEGNIFIWPEFPYGMNHSEYYGFLTKILTSLDPKTALSPAMLESVFRRYPAEPGADHRALASRVFTDFGILCGTNSALSSLAAKQANVFLYRFAHRSSCPEPGPIPGAYHAMELPYVFGTPESYGCSFTEAEAALSARIQEFWTSFAKELTPKLQTESESFPAYGRSGRQHGIVLHALQDGVEDGYRSAYCRFWTDIWRSQLRAAETVLV